MQISAGRLVVPFTLALGSILAACGAPQYNEQAPPPERVVNAIAPTHTGVLPTSGSVFFEGDLVDFEGTVTEQGDDGIESVVWNFGALGNPGQEVVCTDGAPLVGNCTPAASDAGLNGNTVNADFTPVEFTDSGNATVTLTSCDEGGPQACTTTTLMLIVSNATPAIAITNVTPDPALENELVTVTFAVSDPSSAANEIETVTFNWGDGTGDEVVCSPATTPCAEGVGQTATHTYPDDQSDLCGGSPCVITATVLDKDGASFMATDSVQVDNGDPINVLVLGTSARPEGTLVTFTATFDDGAADTHTCTFDWGYPGNVNTVLDPCISGDTVDHAFPDNGDFIVTVTVDDDDLGFGQDNYTQTITNAAPVPDAGGPYTVAEGSSVSYSALFTDPGTGDTHDCNFIWGDGTPDSAISPCISGDTASHVYTVNTSRTLTLEVTDDDGDFGSDTVDVTVSDVNPLITNLQSAGGDEGSVVTISADVASGAADGMSDPVSQCTWDPDDAGPILAQTFAPGTPQCGGTAGSPNSVFTHVYADGPNGYTARLTVDDEDSASSQTTSVSIANANPDVSITSLPSPADEGSAVTVTYDVSDPATVSNEIRSIVVNWGDGNVVTVCDDGGSLPTCSEGAGQTSSHTYTDDSEDVCGGASCTVTVTVTDKDNASDFDQATVDVDNVAPSIDTISAVSPVPEGQAVSVSVQVTDPGTGDAAGLRFDYDWNDNGLCSTAEGDICNSVSSGASHIYPDEGTYTVEVTVRDDDGGTDTDSVNLIVTDTPPSIVSLHNTAPKGEGQSVTAALQMNLVDGDAYSFSYDFGDGNVDNTCDRTCSHVYADEGSYTITVTVTDDENGTDVDTTVADIYNVAPSISIGSGCGSSANGAGGTYDCDVDATDPGATDTITFSLAFGPAGMSIDGGTGLISWLPTASQSRTPQSFQVQAADNDGATVVWSQTVTSYLDTDGDTLPDVWEDENGTDKNTNDANTDDDGDGRSNLQEFQDGTNPQLFDGPDRPIALSPSEGGEVASTTPTLRVQNAEDPDGDPLTYTFEVYSDAALTMLVASTSGVAAGSVQLPGGITATDWTVNASLPDDAWYWWRARGNDGGADGANSTVSSFFVNTANDAPGAPSLSAPADASAVSSLYPTLSVGNATDQDADALTYEFDIADDAGFANVVASSTGVGSGAGTSTWDADTALDDDTLYYWRARATDEHGLSGAYVTGSFFVNTTNNPPAAVVLQGPADGSEVTSATPALTVENSTDSDGDTLVYHFEIDTTPAFTAPIASGPVVEVGAGQTSFTPAALAENTEYWWRARAFDGTAAGDWASGSFFVNVANDAPGQPVAQNPADGAIVDRKYVQFTLRNADDPDRDAVSYVFTIWKDEEMTEAFETSAVIAAGANGETSFVPAETLKAGKSYWWTATAQDDSGLEGTASAAQRFQTNGGESDSVGSCTVAGGRQASPVGLVLLLMGLAGVLVSGRRKRRAEA